ncbi:hypothetical protein DRN69_06845 [Candidatus Pacearchaeota archaeon]|nr:MAG: hypothetical protein DRN69_06845 [Candidatus Pacearchaeota archaeon]
MININEDHNCMTKKIGKELERYNLMRKYYIEYKGRENFNREYLLKITRRLEDISKMDISPRIKFLSLELFRFFKYKSRYM